MLRGEGKGDSSLVGSREDGPLPLLFPTQPCPSRFEGIYLFEGILYLAEARG